MNQLLTMAPREYNALVKERLRDNEGWAPLIEGPLLEKTRNTLAHMLVSIDEQIMQHVAKPKLDADWLRRINALRKFVEIRYDGLPEMAEGAVSGNKETKAWQAFSARLATALEENDQTALDRIKTPYGGLTARQWLTKREEKSV